MTKSEICDMAWKHALFSGATGMKFFEIMTDKVIEVAQLEEHRLRAFAQQIMTDWQEYKGIDGMTLQEIAVEHGLLQGSIQHQPCGDNCNCEWYAEPTVNDWKEGVRCYRATLLLKGSKE